MEYSGLDLKGAKLFKMDEETDKKNSKVMRIGLDMCELILRIKNKFKDCKKKSKES